MMVPRVHASDFTVENFLRDYWIPGRPVVISGAVEDWICSTEWTLDNLRKRFGKTNVSCRQTHLSSYRNGSRYTTQTMTVRKYNN